MAKNIDPLVRQIRQLLNSYGQMPDKALDESGGARDQQTGTYTFPILHKVLGMGYGYGANQGLDSWLHSFDTDKDAIGQAITNLRGGAALGQTRLKIHNPYKEDSASNNLYRSLIDERIKAGLSPEEAHASVANAVKGELTASRAVPTVDRAVDPNSTLNPTEQEVVKNRAVGANTDSPNANWDTAAMANEIFLKRYYDRGTNDIQQYGEVGNVLSGLVPEQLKPIYQLMVNQRMNEMANNLDLTYSQMRNAPEIQKLKDTASDLRSAASAARSGGGSGSQLLSQALGGLQGQSGTGLTGLSGIGSNGGLDALGASRDITNNLSLGQEYARRFNTFEKPVISNNQVTYLRDFIPRSNKATSLVPQIMSYLYQGSGGY